MLWNLFVVTFLFSGVVCVIYVCVFFQVFVVVVVVSEVK